MRALIAVLFVSLLAGSGARALDEDRVFETITAYVAADRDCAEATTLPGWERRIAEAADGYRLRYSRFGCTVGARGALVIAPGRSEPSYEYAETAIDFIARGFAPVYVVDHRGQGMSPRLLEDTDKAHIDDHETYIDDFEVFVGAVLADLEALGAEVPVYLTSNSLGGAIALGYLQRVGEDAPFAAAALLGTMIHVNYLSFTDKEPTWLNLRIYSETGALLQANFRCTVARLWDADRCTDYAAPETFGAYVPGTRDFTPNSVATMTQSAARYALRTYFWDDFDWSAIAEEEYAEDELWPGPQLGGSTNAWVREAARLDRDIRKPGNLARAVHVPILLMTGTLDLRAYRQYAEWRDKPSDLSRHVAFCDDLNDQSVTAGAGYICDFTALNGGFHEIYKERDSVRDAALDTVDWFFARHAP